MNEKIKFVSKTMAIWTLIIICSVVTFLFLKSYGIYTFKCNSDQASEIINNTILESIWNSNPTLVDDRLKNDDPLFFIASPTTQTSDAYVVNIFVLYNDGKYRTTYIANETKEQYDKSITDGTITKFLKENYEKITADNSGTFLTSDQSVKTIREYYLKQYSLKDLTTSKEINMSITNTNLNINAYGITYNVEELEETENNITTKIIKYMQYDGNKEVINDELGMEILTWLVNLS